LGKKKCKVGARSAHGKKTSDPGLTATVAAGDTCKARREGIHLGKQRQILKQECKEEHQIGNKPITQLHSREGIKRGDFSLTQEEKNKGDV